MIRTTILSLPEKEHCEVMNTLHTYFSKELDQWEPEVAYRFSLDQFLFWITKNISRVNNIPFRPLGPVAPFNLTMTVDMLLEEYADVYEKCSRLPFTLTENTHISVTLMPPFNIVVKVVDS